MLKRDLQVIKLKLSDIYEYNIVKAERKLKSEITTKKRSYLHMDNSLGSGSSTTPLWTSSSTTSTTETLLTQLDAKERLAQRTAGNDNGVGLTRGAGLNDDGTIGDISDDSWSDIDETLETSTAADT